MPARTPLPTTMLGTTGMEISRVGFGAWAIGGGGWRYAWGAQDDDASITAIRHAVEKGVTWIDTAGAYGYGHSEDVVGRALAVLQEADRPYVFTKGGLRVPGGDPSLEPQRIGDAASLRSEVEQSLRLLRVERIDLYQMHWPADDCGIEEYWPVFQSLLDEGKVRAIGLSNHSVSQLDAAEAIAHVDSIQPQLSLLHRETLADLLPWARAHDTGAIVYSPMASGMLTGAFTAERAAALGADDWRSSNPDFSGAGLTRNLALVDALRPIAEHHGVSVGAVAIAWTLTVPGVSGAIVGARSPEQVDGWIPAASLQLSVAERTTISDALVATEAGEGPVS